MVTYKTVEQMESELFPFLFDGDINRIRLFIKGDDPEKRLDACLSVKRLLEGILESAKADGDIKGYKVEVIDLLTESPPGFADEFSSFWNRIGEKHGKVFIPIFHNSGNHLYLPQEAFDNNIPGIFSLTSKEYLYVVNPSKRDCYDLLLAD